MLSLNLVKRHKMETLSHNATNMPLLLPCALCCACGSSAADRCAMAPGNGHVPYGSFCARWFCFWVLVRAWTVVEVVHLCLWIMIMRRPPYLICAAATRGHGACTFVGAFNVVYFLRYADAR